MARKRFDLLDSTKKEIFNGGRVATVAAMLGAAITPGIEYHPTFGNYAQYAFIGGLFGFGLSLTISTLRDVMPAAQPQPARSFGVQSHSDSTALPAVAGEDYIPVNTGDKSIQLRRGDFEAAIPADFGGAYSSQPRTINRWGLRDLIAPRKPEPIIARQLQAPRPVMREEIFFWSCGVQLAGSVVWRFLRYAERNRTHGKGLSERYWTRRNRSEWWNEAYYGPMIAMLDYASKKSGVQLVIVQENKWRVLAKDCKTTYKVIAWAMHGAG